MLLPIAYTLIQTKGSEEMNNRETLPCTLIKYKQASFLESKKRNLETQESCLKNNAPFLILELITSDTARKTGTCY